MAAEFLEQFLKRDLEEDKEDVKNFEQKIREAKEERKHVSPEEKDRYDALIENLEQAKQEREQVINKTERILEKGVGDSFQEYLAEAKGTGFEKDPDKAISEYDKGVIIDRSFPCEECLQPIRDKDSVPLTGLHFYLPETGSIITRNFYVDQNDLVYSEYTIKTEKGEIYKYTDRNITKKEWNENEQCLSDLINRAGIIPSNIPCRVFLTKEQLENYIENHDKTKTKSEREVKRRKEKEEPDFSNEDVEAEVEHSKDQEKKRKASTKTDESVLTFEVPKDSLSFDKNNEMLLISSDLLGQQYWIPTKDILFGDIEKNGKISFSVKKDATVFWEAKNIITGERSSFIDYFTAEGLQEEIKSWVERANNKYRAQRHESRK